QNSSKIKKFVCKELIDFIEEESSFHLINTHKRVCIAFINIIKGNINDLLYKKSIESILESINKYGGFLDKCDFNTIGDKLMIVFGAPKSISDIEEKTIRFIFEAKNIFENNNIIYKMGIESGYAFCGIIGNDDRREYTIMGDTVNTTARIMSIADKNEVLISDNIFKNVGTSIDTTKKGVFKLKGKKNTVLIYKLTGNLKSGLLQYWTDNTNAFSGRKKEITQIDRTINRVLKSNKELLVIKGKSGTGKSILISKIIDMIQDRFVILILRCREFNKTIPFSVIKVMLLQIAGLTEDAGLDKIVEQLIQYCSKEQLKYIKKLFSKSILKINKQDKTLLFNALSHILNEYFKGIPLSIIFDDY
ncbi:AAA family ATPase, partial [candidate division WOR-3 bacterium]|nr:AAA family ATPase [candidate division WOR-3 bacterium]